LIARFATVAVAVKKTIAAQQEERTVLLLFLLRMALTTGIVRSENKTKLIIGKETSRMLTICFPP
jgi:hypothetical protein